MSLKNRRYLRLFFIPMTETNSTYILLFSIRFFILFRSVLLAVDQSYKSLNRIYVLSPNYYRLCQTHALTNVHYFRNTVLFPPLFAQLCARAHKCRAFFTILFPVEFSARSHVAVARICRPSRQRRERGTGFQLSQL